MTLHKSVYTSGTSGSEGAQPLNQSDSRCTSGSRSGYRGLDLGAYISHNSQSVLYSV